MQYPNLDSKVNGARERIATSVRVERARRRLRQADVAALAGVSPTRVYELERGQRDPNFVTVLRILSALGLTLAPVDESAQPEAA